MSSLAASRADGYYYDPSRFDPKKRGRDSVNALAGSHPLGDRAKKFKSEGILVIRFEMPYDCWCLGCGMHIARGVRFNADKKKAGAYFTTPIWEFSFKCTNPDGCTSHIVIRTDPEHSDYVFVSGARKKDRGEGAEDAIVLETERGSASGLSSHPREGLSSLEKNSQDAIRAAAHAHRLQALAQESEARYGMDRDVVNARARGIRREEALLGRIAAAEGAAAGLTVPLARYDDEVDGEGEDVHYDAEGGTGGALSSLGMGSFFVRARGEAESEAPATSSSLSQSLPANGLTVGERLALLHGPALPKCLPRPPSLPGSTSTRGRGGGRGRGHGSARMVPDRPSTAIEVRVSSSQARGPSVSSIVLQGLARVRHSEGRVAGAAQAQGVTGRTMAMLMTSGSTPATRRADLAAGGTLVLQSGPRAVR